MSSCEDRAFNYFDKEGKKSFLAGHKTLLTEIRVVFLYNIYDNVLDYTTLKYTPPAVRSNILSKPIFASCVWYSDRAYYWLCVLIKGIGRRLPLQLQCSYQGQQGAVRQSVRGNYKTRF